MPGKKLLVADDSLTIQKVIRLALSNEGYEIQAVSDGNDAVQQVSLFHPDVVLIDVSLPGKTAFEVKRAINEMEDLEEVRFVLMSSAFEKVDEGQAEEVKFHGRLTKPFDPAHLRQVLTDVLAQVTAKRMEKTAMLVRPTPEMLKATTPAPAAPAMELPPPIPADSPEIMVMPESMQETDTSIVADISEPPPPPSSESITLAPPEDDGKISLTPPEMLDASIIMQPTEEFAPPEWNDPIRPDDVPIVAAPDHEPVANLWDAEPTLTLPPRPASPAPVAPPPELPKVPATPPAPAAPRGTSPAFAGLQVTPPPPPDAPRHQDDIRELTESTLRMSGLADEFNWSVKEPSLKPLPGFSDNGDSGFVIEPPLDGIEPSFMPSRAEEIDNPALAVTPPPAPPKAAPPQQPARPAAPPAPPQAQARPAPAMSPPSFEPNVVPVSTSDMEEMIRRQVREALEKMAQKMLPDLAERVLKDEIHKLLSEQQ